MGRPSPIALPKYFPGGVQKKKKSIHQQEKFISTEQLRKGGQSSNLQKPLKLTFRLIRRLRSPGLEHQMETYAGKMAVASGGRKREEIKMRRY